jgi:lon-related putative ATP-dependent protease
LTKELNPKELRVECEAADLGCKTSADFSPLKTIVGQKRALQSLDFGLHVQDRGFNITVTGMPGTGRTTAVMAFLEELAEKQPVPSDWCYVSNFADEYEPRALEIPAGKGKRLVGDMDKFIEAARTAITRMLESEEYARKREERGHRFEAQRDELTQQMRQRAQKAGFALEGTQTGLLMVPMVDGKPVTPDMVERLPASARKQIETHREALESELSTLFRKIRTLERDLREDLSKMEAAAVNFTLEPLIAELKEEYGAFPKVVEFVQAVAKDITENLNEFIGRTQSELPAALGARAPSPEEFAQRYRVNLIVNNADRKGAPVLIVSNPTYANLFGRIEKEPRFGALVTDFSMIRGGALHEANGGYLIVPTRELLLSPLSYDALKRALKDDQIAIEEPGEALGFFSVKTLRPEPIPLKAKIITIGDPYLYELLYEGDPDFRELFKVRADFDSSMPRNDENIRLYGSFICTLAQKESLQPLSAEAVGEIVDYSSRLAEDKTKLSTRFDIISDVIREANFYAKDERAKAIQAKHIKHALEERIYRSNLIEEKIHEFIEKGVILIDTDGTAVGQVNGLSVIGLGDFTFGQPSRVTASVGPGRGRIVDIEREAKLSGPIHTKGVLILSGYLASKYSADKPLSLSARLVFEQSYSGVEGDSASSTELYALLSALSNVPIQQRFAVTGSVNQRGQVQAIGGVNEKIEGFYAVCKTEGLTGNQGVMIPKSNVQNLMLKDEVVEAVRAGKFHIYPVETIDEGIELLTGKAAGTRRPDGSFPPGSVNGLVEQRLREMIKAMQKPEAPGTSSGDK